MAKLRYRDLTLEQIKTICNGCGGKGGFIDPPEFLFHASCNQHDFYYWRGGTEKDRLEADKAFYRYMQLDAIRPKSKYMILKYKLIAYIYYKAVRLAGKKFFNYGIQRTKLDLLKL